MMAEDPFEEALVGIRAELTQLTDLFRRRLMDDKVRNALTESLQEQVRESRDLLRRRQLASVINEVLLVVDRLQSEPATAELVESAAGELLEVLARRSLEPVGVADMFDSSIHEAIAVVPATSQAPPGTIVTVHRTGYTLDGRLLRPAQVTVTTTDAGQLSKGASDGPD